MTYKRVTVASLSALSGLTLFTVAPTHRNTALEATSVTHFTVQAVNDSEVRRGIAMCDDLITRSFAVCRKITVQSAPVTGKKYNN